MRFSGHIARALLATVALGSQPAVHADSPLADLIQNGRRAEALRLIDSDGDVNRVQSDGTTPLHWAVYREDPALVDRLLEAGADPSVTNRYGSSPLAEAVKIADAALVETLLEAGADPEAVNADGQTALMLAARTGSVDVAKHLIEHGADVNAEESFRGQTALMWAVDGNFADLATYLVEEGADVTTRAAVNDWPAQITSEPRAQYRPTGGLTPLLFAARSGCLDCIRAIVGAGENIDRPTPEGVTPLMLAIDNMNFAAANLLLDLGANPYYSDWWGRTALYLAVDMNSYPAGVEEAPVPEAGADGSPGVGAMDIIRRLLAAGVEVNPQLNMHRVGRGGNSQRFTDDLLTTGATPLLRAAITHDHEVMRLLLEHGARVDLPNVMGVTPLMAAAGLGVREPGFGSNRAPHFDSDPRIEDKVIGSLEILLAAGADINARVTDTHSRTARIARPSQLADREGQTALFRAAGRGWARVVEYMLEHGARADVTDMLGHTARDAAMGRLASGAPVFEDVAAALGD
jgi:ankyrin repeat protein